MFREGEAAASGTAAAAAAETSNLEALGKQIEKLHKKATQERLRELKLINMEIMERTNRNAEIGRHLTGLGQVVEEQRRLRASMGSMDDGVRRMRSLVTHKKLKDIALAQADEVRALAAELDHLRQHTYPTFVEPSLAGVADVRVDPQRASLRAPGGSLRGKHLTKSLGRLF
uniref:Uncharacterized protein n=1 Tax=Dunaliella tertiolecta TaxID=3047 RepID=A0A7S3QWW0_DUNTE